MQQFLALVLTVVICSTATAQERSESTESTRDETKERQRATGAERRRNPDNADRKAPGRDRAAASRNGRASRKVEVKDPAEFSQLTDDTVFSGPQAGEKLPSFKATGLAGDIKDKEIDPIAVAGSSPHILLMQDDEGVGIRGLLGMVRLLAKANTKIDQKLHMTCVFLTDDIEKTTAGANRFGKVFLSAGLDVLVVSKDGREGPGTYGLNRNVSQTVLLSKDGEVTHNFVFPQGSLYADPHVLGGVAELLKVEREKLAGWLNEAPPAGEMARSGAMRRDGDAMKRDSSRTRDEVSPASGKVALRAKLEKLIASEKLTREEAIDLYQTAFPEDKPRGTRDGDRR